MNYNVKIKINPEKLTNKDGKEVCENIQLRFIENDRFGTAQKMKFFITDFFSKCDQIRRKLGIWSHLLKKHITENFIFCEVWGIRLR